MITNTVALNGGDAAILLAISAQVREVFGDDADISVFESNPDVASKYYPAFRFRPVLWNHATHFFRWLPRGRRTIQALFNWRLLAAARLLAAGRPFLASVLTTRGEWENLKTYAESDVVISTGGTYLVGRYNLRLRVLEFSVINALRKPLILYTQSIGPFTRRVAVARLAKELRRARAIFVRDERSVYNLEAIGVPRERCRVCNDVVFSLGAREPARSVAPLPRRPLRIAVSVREWPLLGDEGIQRYESTIARCVEHLVTTYDASVTFVSTCQGVPEYQFDDSKVAQAIRSRLPDEIKPRVLVDTRFHHPTELQDFYRDVDLVVATRMHATILALVAGTPVVNIAYEFKSKELFEANGWRELVCEIDTITGDGICRLVDDAIRRLADIRRDIAEKTPHLAASARIPMRLLRELQNDV